MDNSDDYSGDDLTAPAVGVPGGGGGYLPGDVYDAQQMEPFTPAPAREQGVPWWAGAAVYGITKAIDNQFPGSPSGIMGNTYPGSGAGWNGRTYTMRPTGAGGGMARAQLGVKGDPMLLIGGLVVLALLLRK